MYSTYLVSCIYIYIDIVKGSFVEEAPSYGKLTSEIMKSHSHWPKDHCVQLAPALSHILTSPKIIVSSWHLCQEIMKSHSH